MDRTAGKLLYGTIDRIVISDYWVIAALVFTIYRLWTACGDLLVWAFR